MMCAFHGSLHMCTLSASAGSYPIICTHTASKTRKTSHTRNQSNQALVNKFNMLSNCGFHTIYHSCSNLSLFVGPTLPYGAILSLAILDAWKSTVVPNLSLKSYAPAADRGNTEGSSVTCFSWLKTRSSVHFIALLSNGSFSNSVF